MGARRMAVPLTFSYPSAVRDRRVRYLSRLTWGRQPNGCSAVIVHTWIGNPTTHIYAPLMSTDAQPSSSTPGGNPSAAASTSCSNNPPSHS